jgi:methyltransferase (TIGR00027 family)
MKYLDQYRGVKRSTISRTDLPKTSTRLAIMANEAARTGSGPTTLVAIEQFFPRHQRIVDDRLAASILPLKSRAFLPLLRPARDWLVRLTEKGAPGVWALMMCRKRYIDEKLIESVGRIGAIVNLGAGFDTRLYRLPALTNTPAWEVDQRENIDAKRSRLLRLFRALPAHVTLVPIDFDHENLSEVLTAHGYSTQIPTFFIWEGVTQYLTEPAVRATLSFLSAAATGSRLVFTYVLKDFLDGQNMFGHEYLYKRYIQKERLWLYGMAPESIKDFLASYGWSLIEDLDFAELAERYVKPTGRILSSTPIERVVYAQKF